MQALKYGSDHIWQRALCLEQLRCPCCMLRVLPNLGTYPLSAESRYDGGMNLECILYYVIVALGIPTGTR